MKNTILLLILFLLTSGYVFSQDQISISFSSNSSNELVMRVEGHTTPITIKIGDNKITLHVIENTVNLTALGINDLTDVSVVTEEKTEEIDTAAGTESSNISTDTQSPIPPISGSINPNPPLSTPF